MREQVLVPKYTFICNKAYLFYRFTKPIRLESSGSYRASRPPHFQYQWTVCKSIPYFSFIPIRFENSGSYRSSELEFGEESKKPIRFENSGAIEGKSQKIQTGSV